MQKMQKKAQKMQHTPEKCPPQEKCKKKCNHPAKNAKWSKCKKKSIKNAVAYLSLPSSIAMTDLRMMIPLGVALQAENKSSFPEDSLGRHRSLFKKEDMPRLIGGSESHLKKAPFSGKKNWTPTDTFLVEQ